MNMHQPAHPGEAIRKLGLEPLGLTVAEAAKALGVTRKTLSEIINCRAGISVEMALRLAKAFDTTPESWLRMQEQYDLAKARKRVSLGKVPFESRIGYLPFQFGGRFSANASAPSRASSVPTSHR